MTLLPETFAFGQSSLQAFVDCPRRFWLTYVEQLPWPAVQATPLERQERMLRLGSLFHRLVERRESGISAELLAQGLADPLDGWFDAYLRHRPEEVPKDFVEVEKVLSAPYGDYRLAAKYDLIAAVPGGRVVIVDWKTGARRPQPRQVRERLQSVVYPYLLVEAGDSLLGRPVLPEQVEFIYWFTAAPTDPIQLEYDAVAHYNAVAHEANRERLEGILAKILSGTGQEDFPKVTDTEANRRRYCDLCVYRSRCDRGITAGAAEDLPDPEDAFVPDLESALEFTLDEVAALEF